jgi:hypothetical protein
VLAGTHAGGWLLWLQRLRPPRSAASVCAHARLWMCCWQAGSAHRWGLINMTSVYLCNMPPQAHVSAERTAMFLLQHLVSTTVPCCTMHVHQNDH